MGGEIGEIGEAGEACEAGHFPQKRDENYLKTGYYVKCDRTCWQSQRFFSPHTSWHKNIMCIGNGSERMTRDM